MSDSFGQRVGGTEQLGKGNAGHLCLGKTMMLVWERWILYVEMKDRWSSIIDWSWHKDCPNVFRDCLECDDGETT